MTTYLFSAPLPLPPSGLLLVVKMWAMGIWGENTRALVLSKTEDTKRDGCGERNYGVKSMEETLKHALKIFSLLIAMSLNSVQVF